MRKFVLALALVVLAAGAFFWYDSSFSIAADCEDLAGSAAAFLSRGTQEISEQDIVLYDTAVFGSQRIVLAEISGQLGEIWLSRGLNGKYKIEHIGRRGNHFRTIILGDGEQDYVLVMVQNAAFDVGRVELTVDGEPYGLDISGETACSLVYTEINNSFSEHEVDLDSIRFYSASGGDVTELVWN